MENVEAKNKPTTKNINGIITDIEKISTYGVKDGVVAFVLFPVDNEEKYKKHVGRIVGALRDNTTYVECVVGQFYVFSAKV